MPEPSSRTAASIPARLNEADAKAILDQERIDHNRLVALRTRTMTMRDERMQTANRTLAEVRQAVGTDDAAEIQAMLDKLDGDRAAAIRRYLEEKGPVVERLNAALPILQSPK